MPSIDIASILRDTLIVAIKLGAPALLSALGVGLVISFIQAVTQINETTLAFVPKILAVGFSMIAAGSFIYATLTSFMQRIWDYMIAAGGT